MPMISTYMGFAIAAVVLWFGVIAHTANPAIFLDPHALILVVGGTAAAGLIAFPLQRFQDLLKFVVFVVLYPSKTMKLKIAEHIIRMAGIIQGRIPVNDFRDGHHPLLAEGYSMIRKMSLTSDEFKRVLSQRNQSVKDRYNNDAKMLNALAKFPPAFGLLGATTGMIAMMANLGTSGQDSIGPAMAIALVATFWGIAVANLVLLPLADHASRMASDQSHLRAMILAGLVLVQEKADINFIYETMCSYLPIEQRANPELRSLKNQIQAADEDQDAGAVLNMDRAKAERAAR